MKKITLLLLMILGVSFCTAYAQDCSDRIQAAGRIYERYKKSYDKKQLDEARKQLNNIKSSNAPENCKKEADRLLKLWKPIYKPKTAKANVEVAAIVVRDTVIERHINIDTVVNVLVHQDSFKVKRFYDVESAAMECANKKDFECAVNNYQTAIAFGRDLHLSDEIISELQYKEQKNKKLRFNELLAIAKKSEYEGQIHDALQQYESVLTYGNDNKLVDEEQVKAFADKAEYLQYVEEMFDYARQADEYYRAHEWELAKQELTMAIEMSDTLGWKPGVILWKHRLDTVERIINIGDDILDYSTLNSLAYDDMHDDLTKLLHHALLHFQDIPTDTLTVGLIVFPKGEMDVVVDKRQEDTLVTNTIKREILQARLKLPAMTYWGQEVTAKASYDYVISVESAISTVKRKPKKLIEKLPMIGVGPLEAFINKTEDTVRRTVLSSASKPFLYGTFYFKQSVSQIDNSSGSGFHLVKYSGTGGPANVFLSMIVPGLGRHRVTYGEQLGIGTTVVFFGSTAAALGLRYYALDKKSMDLKNLFKFEKKEYFDTMEQGQPHQVAYWTSYAFAGVAAVVYVTDVLYTLIRGSVNLSRQNKYKKWAVGAFYDPSSKTPLIQYNYKIK